MLNTLVDDISDTFVFSAEPIRIFYGTHTKTEISNATTLTVGASNLLWLEFNATRQTVEDMAIDYTNMTTSFRRKFREVNPTSLCDTHLLEVTESSSMTVRGLLDSTSNTNYKIIIYFKGELNCTILSTRITQGTCSTLVCNICYKAMPQFGYK